MLLDLGKVFLDHGPDLVQIEAEVLMHQDVPQRDDLWPRHLGMTRFEGLGHAAGGFSDYLQVVDRPDLEHLVVLQGINAIRDSFSDFRGGREDIAHALRVAPHKAMASRQTDSRIEGFTQPSLAMSTFRPNRLSSSSMRAAWSRRLVSSLQVTSRSTSLSGRASPRAIDPISRTSVAPCLAAMRTIASRCSRMVSLAIGSATPLSPSEVYRRCPSRVPG